MKQFVLRGTTPGAAICNIEIIAQSKPTRRAQLGGACHPYTIDRWDDATGENLIERIAGVSDYLIAVETYRAAVKRWPGAKITLRNRARVIEQSWRD
jgi:hypothetical protein